MELDIACLCREASQNAAGEAIVSGIFRRVTAESLPHTVDSFFCVFAYRCGPEEAGEKTMTLELLGLEGELVERFEKQVPIEAESRDEPSFLVVPFRSIVLERPGRHELRLSIPGLVEKTLPLELVQRNRRIRKLPLA